MTELKGPLTSSELEVLQHYIHDRMPHYLSWFERMVGVNSFFENRAGVKENEKLVTELFGSLDFKPTVLAATNCGDHLVLERAGIGTTRIGLVSHLDTVYTAEEELRNNFFWREEGDRIYGPGTYDIKGGTIVAYMMLDGLHALRPELFSTVDWITLLDGGEEIFAKDFPPIMQLWLDRPETLACLVFEGGRRREGSESIVVARKGRAVVDIEVHGRASHAGVDHQQGANAIVQLAHLISEIADFTDYDKEITFTPGVVCGGTVVNRVPDQAYCELEMRAFDPSVFQEGLEKLSLLTRKVSVRSPDDGFPCEIKIKIRDIQPAWGSSENSEELFQLWNNAAQTNFGKTLIRERRGGLTDANRIASLVPTIDGLGPIGGNDHNSEHSADGSKVQEHIEKSSLATQAMLHISALVVLLQGSSP